MPPSAASNRPTRRRSAPVKAPRSCPNSSLSSSASGSAAQLIATNGPPARGLSSWIARANTSLPTPDSPSSSTVRSVGTALRTRSTVGASPASAPTIPRKPARARSSSVRRRTCRDSRPIESAFFTAMSSRSMSNGLAMKSCAPSFIASTARSTVPKAVIMITGRSGTRRRARRRTSSPSIPGSITSSRQMSGGSSSIISTACSPVSASATRKPRRASVNERSRRRLASSSTTRIVGAAAVIVSRPPAPNIGRVARTCHLGTTGPVPNWHGLLKSGRS